MNSMSDFLSIHTAYTSADKHTKDKLSYDTALFEYRLCIVKADLALLQTFAPTVRSPVPPTTPYTSTIHQE